MQTEPIITFQNVDPSEAVNDRLHGEIKDLESFFPDIVGCEVVVASPHRHGNKGNLYEIRIHLGIPGNDIHITREAGLNHAHEDIYVAIRDAFAAAKRKLEDRARLFDPHRQKRHPATMHGVICRLFNDDQFGFIELADGDEVYFQADSLTKADWGKLREGMKVRFNQMDGQKGPFAVHVTPIE